MGIIDFAQEGEFAIKEHDFNPEAPLSPLYINLRNLPIAISHQIGLAMAQIPEDGLKPEWCVGIPDAGIPLAISYATVTGIDYGLALQKGITTDGKRKIEPYTRHPSYFKGKVRIIDDVMSQGHSKIEAVNALRSIGFEPTDLTILIDREQGGKAYVERELNILVRSVFTLTQLLDYYLRTGQVTQEQYVSVMQYLDT
ncbi:hypothetical protein COU89_00800 [Candidatus Roizmanbacteria bacterium CG10_big_fil_rev_8_21_14_0_10_45_7]|uniref:Orotate phosphoribosyltransferase n=1 Tax=Candidatus Roizmanbacteria bacterium CG10_big_fil_rev_8_21_14_0_10_45_7 TaxID=1974854 RepID=A0A2M8KVF5_9BACT|nr:MAG: hypothetical protein COU89_00800 [Candidatus Roizmanbacteria bacterium CG10_big_fil_rev_8_21_14_0_10_45_7]